MIADYEKYIERGLHTFCQHAIQTAKNELSEQGHRVTGETERSFQYEIRRTGTALFSIVFSANLSAIILNEGVAANRVPYSQSKRGQGRGGKSKYIEALLAWAANVRPELSVKEQKSFVFAVAAKAKKEGHPTKGSFKFSKNNRRKDWISFSFEMDKTAVDDFVKPFDFVSDLVKKRKK